MLRKIPLRTTFKVVFFLIPSLLLPFTVGPVKADVSAGFDLFETVPTTQFNFADEFTIPANFFDPGSLPFGGPAPGQTVPFQGVPLITFMGFNTGTTDTIVQRKATAVLPPPFPVTDTIPIELVALSLVSTSPITVTYSSGVTQSWNIRVSVSPSRPSNGTITITQIDPTGGTFTSTLSVFPLFTFTRISDGAVRTIDVGALPLNAMAISDITLQPTTCSTPPCVPWVTAAPPPVLVVQGLNNHTFYPSATSAGKTLTEEEARLAKHGVRPAQPDLREIDTFPASTGRVTILTPTGAQDIVQLAGPSSVAVNLTSIRPVNGLDTVDTEMLQLDLTGTSGLLGPVRVTLDPTRPPTVGQIQENVNNNPGILDIPPFEPTGTARSFFDVFFEIQAGGHTLHGAQPAIMQATITHKPPAAGETYDNHLQAPIPLLDDLGNPTGFSVVNEFHTPNPLPVGGVLFSGDKPAGLAQYVGLVSVIAAASVATAIYVRRVRRKEKL